MKRLILAASLLALSTLTFAQTEVGIGVMRGKDYGVTYALPKTQLQVIVNTDKVTYTPGEFYQYADYYLRLKEVGTAPQTYWEIKDIQIKSVGEPDSDNVYFIKMKDKSIAPLVELTADGIICSINIPFTPSKRDKTEEVTDIEEKVDPYSFLTEEILTSNSTAKMADLVAKEIYSIRESKNALIKGQADFMPQDGAQMKLMLKNLDIQDEALTALFAGTYQRENKRFTITLHDITEMDKELIFRFSRKLGIVDKEDLAGEPIYLSLKDLKTLNIPNVEKVKKPEGIAYNVPGKALVTLFHGNRMLMEREVPVTQFGCVEYLAEMLFNKNSTLKVRFDPATGGLLKVDREENK